MPRNRNYKNIQFANIREKIDPIVNNIVDELDTAYYKFWKNGGAFDFYGVDKSETTQPSKVQFDQIHAAIYHMYDILFDEFNQLQTSKIDESKYNFIGNNPSIKKTDVSKDNIRKIDAKLNAVIVAIRKKLISDIQSLYNLKINLKWQ